MHKYDIPKSTLHKMYVEQEMTMREIAAHFGCSEHTIGDRLYAYGIPSRDSNYYRKAALPYDELHDLYIRQKYTTREIAEHFNCSKTTIVTYLNAYNIEIRSQCYHQLRQYVPSEVYETITSDVAYALGLLATDGHLAKDYNEVGLTSTDLEIIELFMGCLQMDPSLEPKVKKGTTKPAYVLRFADGDFRTFLEKIGLTPAKSKTIGQLTIPDKVMPDFLRGCWDGDGCWNIDGRRLRGYLTSGSPAFLTWVQASIVRLADLRGYIHGIHLVYNNRNAVDLGYWLYRASLSSSLCVNTVPALSRKYNIWRQFAT